MSLSPTRRPATAPAGARAGTEAEHVETIRQWLRSLKGGSLAWPHGVLGAREAGAGGAAGNMQAASGSHALQERPLSARGEGAKARAEEPVARAFARAWSDGVGLCLLAVALFVCIVVFAG